MLTLANNHRFDCGDNRVGETIRAVSGAGLVPIGPRPEPVYWEVNGLKVAFVAFDDVLSPVDAAAAALEISEARDRGAVVIVSVHWGMEYQEGVTDRQKYLARQFAGVGAALIFGTHPHVLERAEWVQGPSSAAVGLQSGPLHGTLVLYSLGNALFDQGGLPDTRRSALVVVTLDEEGVESVRVVPFVLDPVESRVVAPDLETAKIIREQLNLP
jgi:poly-gamma-glutamate synthesis protein (capsule biosynthesis protein)